MLERLIFGTGGLHRLPTAAGRQRLLAAVLDAGFRSFDAAPAYGNGIDEVEVGRALRGRSGEFLVNTKFGIPVPEYGAWTRHAFAIRRLADKLMGASAAGYRRREFSRGAMTSSVEGSLRRLAGQGIDVLFVHEPLQSLDARTLDEIREAAARLKAAGKIRRLGVAGTAASVARCTSLDGFDAIQGPCAEAEGLTGLAPGRPLVLYETFQAYRSGAPGAGFPAFVRARLDALPGARVIVATRRADRVGTFREIAA